jgi:hypothetical protein
MKPLLSTCASLLSALLLAACAADPAASTVATATPASGADHTASDVICAKEYPTGSNIAVTKCRSREQVEAEKANASHGLARGQAGGPNAKMGGN